MKNIRIIGLLILSLIITKQAFTGNDRMLESKIIADKQGEVFLKESSAYTKRNHYLMGVSSKKEYYQQLNSNIKSIREEQSIYRRGKVKYIDKHNYFYNQ